jgi:hypothetical protein
MKASATRSLSKRRDFFWLASAMKYQLRQIRRWMAERLGEVFEDELGERPEGLRPALAGEHGLWEQLLKHAK